jgi:hypothetical protein
MVYAAIISLSSPSTLTQKEMNMHIPEGMWEPTWRFVFLELISSSWQTLLFLRIQ